MRHLTFNVDHENFRDVRDGSTLILRSPDGSSPEWRCEVRRTDGSWGQVIRIEIGPSLEGGLGAHLGGKVQDPRADDQSVRPLSMTDSVSAVEAAFKGALDFKATSEVAQILRQSRDFGTASEDAFGHAVVAQKHDLRKLAMDDPVAIASLYQRFVENGVRDPTARLVELLGVSRATVSRRIAIARRKGYLGPALKGKAGSPATQLSGERAR